MRKIIVPVLAVLLVAACATPVTQRPDISDAELRREIQRNREMAVKQFMEDSARLFHVSYPIFKHNASQCKQGSYKGVKPSLGFDVWNDYAVEQEYRDAAHALGLKEALSVRGVAKGSPAARADIRAGDRLVSVDGKKFSTRTTAPQEFDDAVELATGKTVEVVIKRGKEKLTKQIARESICEYPVFLDYESPDVNAYTDGERIVMSKGLLRFARNDTEVAMVVAHELAHITMTHIDKQRQNAIVGTLGGLVLDVAAAAAGVNTGGEIGRIGGGIGATRFSVEFEQEADYVGMYYLARAGYSTQGVEDFWRRMAIESPSKMVIRTTHPTSPERFLAIQRTHNEIAQKIAGKQTLLPNLKQK